MVTGVPFQFRLQKTATFALFQGQLSFVSSWRRELKSSFTNAKDKYSSLETKNFIVHWVLTVQGLGESRILGKLQKQIYPNANANPMYTLPITTPSSSSS